MRFLYITVLRIVDMDVLFDFLVVADKLFDSLLFNKMTSDCE